MLGTLFERLIKKSGSVAPSDHCTFDMMQEIFTLKELQPMSPSAQSHYKTIQESCYAIEVRDARFDWHHAKSSIVDAVEGDATDRLLATKGLRYT